jgi:gliding motility-associated-like protein
VSEVAAGFTFEVRGLCSEFVFTDTSKNAISYSWNFDHPTSYKRNTSILQNPSHTYGKDKGEYTVSQIVISAEGCKDTFLQNIEVEYITDLNVYNVFTPNSDGPNEVFQMDIENYDLYNFKIFNRYGELVFESAKPSYAWNGKQDNVGNDLPESTYFYVFRYRYNCDGKIREVEGLVDLIR